MFSCTALIPCFRYKKEKINKISVILVETSPKFTVFSLSLNRCGSKQGEEDYRPLFENFVQDLLSTVNKPEWPAAELLLSLLGRLLVRV